MALTASPLRLRRGPRGRRIWMRMKPKVLGRGAESQNGRLAITELEQGNGRGELVVAERGRGVAGLVGEVQARRGLSFSFLLQSAVRSLNFGFTVAISHSFFSLRQF